MNQEPNPSRRAFLNALGLSAAVVGAGAVLSACGAQGSSAQPAAATNSVAEGSGTKPVTETSTQGPEPLKVPVASVPVGSGIVLAESGIVVTQPTAGTFEAFDVTCPHQGNPVSEVVPGKYILCAFHNSKFALADGSVVGGPAQRGLKQLQVAASGTDLVVTR